MNVEHIIKTKKKIPIDKRTIIHLSLVNTMLDDVMNAALKPFQVSLQQFNVLRILRGQKGIPANLSTLNERMVAKMSNTSRLVDKLLLKGYVKRNICKENRRKVEIFVTKQGEEILDKMDSAIIAAERQVLKNFNQKELKELNILLDKF